MRLVLAVCLLAFSFAFHRTAAASAGDQVQAASVDAQTQPESEAQAYLANIDRTLALAFDGQYGNLRRGAEKELQAARDRIAGVLDTSNSVTDIPLDDRIAIQNAADVISSILKNKQKDRMVCKRGMKTGTRFASSECMTVAQREARANSAADATGNVQREKCVPGETSRCGN